MGALGTVGQIAGGIVKGVASSGGPLGGVAKTALAGGNAISGIKKAVTKHYAPPKVKKKSHFKKAAPKTAAPTPKPVK